MKSIVEESLDLLGMTVKDKITGITGVASSIDFDLYGCIQVIITPTGLTKTGEVKSGSNWLDINRIEIVSKKKIMKTPDYTKYGSKETVNGCALKPIK